MSVKLQGGTSNDMTKKYRAGFDPGKPATEMFWRNQGYGQNMWAIVWDGKREHWYIDGMAVDDEPNLSEAGND